MRISQQNGTLSVTGIRELSAANAHLFHPAVATALSPDLQAIEIDLSQTQTLDGAGLGALVSLYETAKEHRKREGFAIRLTNPTPSVQQMIELARLHHLFEITPRGNAPDAARPPINLK
jgi:anti-anti-sigma factor